MYKGAVSHFIHDTLKPDGRYLGNFTKGQIPHNFKQDGAETKLSSGYIYIKIDGKRVTKQQIFMNR